MIIEIVGKPRAGKTALNTLFMFRELMLRGELLRNWSAKIISEKNAKRQHPVACPNKAPIYANYYAEIPIGYNKSFKPYVLNPYYLGLPTAQTKDNVQLVYPCSCLHITEGRKYWDGRESGTMPDNVSQFFETHGHNYLTIIIDVQRGKALDLNIRENVNKFIEVQGMRNMKDAYGRIIRSIWYCREFYSLQDYEAYVIGKSCYYRDTTYSYNGDIYEFFVSCNRQDDYVPAEGKEYSALEFAATDDIRKLPQQIQRIYNMSRPIEFRKRSANTEERNADERRI